MKTNKLISTKTAKEYIAEYDSLKYGAISKVTGKPDALEFYYTIAELEGYLAYVKSKAEKQKVSVSGIAISLAAYPKGARENYDDLTTIVLRPFTSKEDAKSLEATEEKIIETIDPLNGASSHPPL